MVLTMVCSNLDAPLVYAEQSNEDPRDVDPHPHQGERVYHVPGHVVVLGRLGSHWGEADWQHVAADVEEDHAGHHQPAPGKHTERVRVLFFSETETDLWMVNARAFYKPCNGSLSPGDSVPEIFI